MSLSPGTRVGPYEILGAIGAGGMGEVYRAKDTKLNRDVALKILPEAFTTDADRLARFKREAQVLASLNHPNIAAIYGFEDSGATHALIMELVDGGDLSEIIGSGLPIADALPIARQIIDALEAAHEQGIVHRDLKPANIKIKGAWGSIPPRLPDGRLAPARSAADMAGGTVKVLDFGLAKAVDPGTSTSQDAANSPTLTARGTQMGMILGTAAYMSPEQARGRAVDRRADIWAFGAVLYEMLTGRRAFEGDDISVTLASVLKDDVKWDALPADLPASVRRLLRRCLEKDPRKRLSAIGDARLELDEHELVAAAPAAVSAKAAGGGRAVIFALAAVSVAWLITLIPAVQFFRGTTTPPSLPTSFALLPPLGESIQINSNQPDLAISHDGRRIVYSYGDQGSAIVMRRLDQFADTPVPGLGQVPRSPFFSPDDKWMGYFAAPLTGASGHLMKVLIDGGSPFEMASFSGNLRGGAWGRDNTIVFASTDRATGLMRVSADGGIPEVLTKPAAGEADHWWPAIMPDGKHVVFTILRPSTPFAPGTLDLAVLDLATKTWRTIKSSASYAAFIATGHLVYATPQGLFAAPFDPVACEFRGEAVRVTDDVAFKTTGAADVAVSDAGTLAYITGTSGIVSRLAWVDKGVETPISALPRAYKNVLPSRDSSRAAVLLIDDAGEQGLSVLDLMRGTLTLVSPPHTSVAGAVWSHDEKYLYYRGAQGSTQGIFRASAGGASAPELVIQPQAGELLTPISITPDGRSLLVTRTAEDTQDIRLVNLEGKPEVTLLLAESGRLTSARISPDGRWLAYSSPDAEKGSQIFIRPYPHVNGDRRQVSARGGGYPMWSENSGALFFDEDPNGNVFRVDVAPDGRLGTPVQVTPPNAANLQIRDVPTSSGRTIRIAAVLDNTKTNQLRVVLNWFEVVKQKMAGGK